MKTTDQCMSLSRDMLPNPIDLVASPLDLTFEKAKCLAGDRVRQYAPAPVLLAWFDGTTGLFSPQVT